MPITRCFATMFVLAAISLASFAARADVSLPAVIGDNMVLQRNASVPLWGWAQPGEQVSVGADWLTEPVTTTADPGGAWRVRVSTPDAGGPHTLTFSGKNTVKLGNVLIGEVWVCSGQSNMEWPLSRAMNGEEEVAGADYPGVRVFAVERALAVSPSADCQGRWAACTPQTARGFSAVAYFFGRELHRELNVPIGLIGTNWGGTAAEAWTSADTLKKLGGFDELLALLERERKNPGTLKKQSEQATRDWWRELAKRDEGSGPGRWMSPALDDSDWKTDQVPATWQADGLADYDGVVWFRTAVELPNTWSGKDLTLELGPIDDMDTTWFNGTKVGGMEGLGYWCTPRRYSVPASAVQPGRNLIAVRIHDFGGVGGINGKPEQVRIYPRGDEVAAISLVGQWRYRRGAPLKELPPWPFTTELHANTPTALYNGMIAPLTPFCIRGAIWYQGEANCDRSEQYRTLFPALITDWRQHWGTGDFPFYFVQIAPFLYHNTPDFAARLREAQACALRLPHTGMVVTTDVGNPNDIHPTNKQAVGHRLALWAMAKTYGREGIAYSGPLYREMKIEGERIRIGFDHVDGGLDDGGQALTEFTIAGNDRVFHEARAKIEGNTVVVWSDTVPHPVAVRFAWSDAPEPNLKNAAGLPAAPFRTDDWPR